MIRNRRAPLWRLSAWALGFVVAASPFAALAAAGAATEPTAADADCPSVVPCTDPVGCPDLVVDGRLLLHHYLQHQTFGPADCGVVEGEVPEGDRLLLRFPVSTANFGPGSIVIGSPYDHPDWYQLDTCHGHPHFRDYADYRLWTLRSYVLWRSLKAAHPGACSRALLDSPPLQGSGVAIGHKQGFCLVDSAPARFGVCADAARPPQTFDDCLGSQGLSRCWTDYYRPGLDGQWIDVTGLAAGTYVLEVEVNAGRFFTETDYSNNSAAIAISLPGP